MLELLLVIVILVALAGVVWPNLGKQSSGARLELAARQLAGLLQMARAEAMNTGNSYRCRFEVGGMKAVIEEESDPLKQPNVYEPLKTHWSQVDLGKDNIKCLSVQFDPWETQLKEEEAKVLEADDQSETSGLGPPIIFNPDGTSDSVTILLSDPDNQDFTLTVNGLTGQILIDQGNKQDVSQKKTQ